MSNFAWTIELGLGWADIPQTRICVNEGTVLNPINAGGVEANPVVSNPINSKSVWKY